MTRLQTHMEASHRKPVAKLRRILATFSLIQTLLILAAMALLRQEASAQKVFSTAYAHQADVKVFVTDYAHQADLKVFRVDYQHQATGNRGHWFFTQYAHQADKSVFFVEYAHQADLRIFFVEYAHQAGWVQREKSWLMY